MVRQQRCHRLPSHNAWGTKRKQKGRMAQYTRMAVESQVWDPILNKMNASDLRRFPSCPKARAKTDLIERLKEVLDDSAEARDDFLAEYAKYELGGRKHYFVWRLPEGAAFRGEIESRVASIGPREGVDVLAELSLGEETTVKSVRRDGWVIQRRSFRTYEVEVEDERREDASGRIARFFQSQ